MDWQSLGSVLASIVFLREILHNYLPPQVRDAINRLTKKLFTFFFHPNISIIVEENASGHTNEPYEAIQTYLAPKCYASANVLKLWKGKNSRSHTFSMDSHQKLTDLYKGVPLQWTFHCTQKKSGDQPYSQTYENRYFELSFHRKYRDIVSNSYIPYVITEAEQLAMKNREMKLYVNKISDRYNRLWSSVTLSHPSTLHTLAIDPKLKSEIKDDLTRFVNRKEFYRGVGRSWKRGYLLYGPPGTGKTSLIAAIANFLDFDIYDLELRTVRDNSQLRELLTSTKSKSIIVVEDIDCSLDLTNRRVMEKEKREEKPGQREKTDEAAFTTSLVSLSGVLNFVDGLWSSCGGERIMIFTTNHKENLDPALLRPGRMDKHILLSYCEFEAFKILANNYCGLSGEHPLMKEVEEALRVVQVTPAEIAELFMGSCDDPDLAMETVLEDLQKRQAIKNESLKFNLDFEILRS
ncbi:hypothetical protein AMTRI_Chr12g275080 [Amborella trichopoda]|uniref:AAA+ ATPase domain-containing protein n=1 Tax=Amborella trichopoda TaxID=13333 RepID=W1PIF0_AMBTC|nr:AAA-ATPase At3g50940 [Amborella trichopoda]ERN07406.1 hypothetical protein AMTR_s00019p00244830 [Amborella trichopoda]|eukprot:XP_006845731.1 AAA-ATPase At3g50940 [Amborella trichopoda]